jgi:hypothetical protein
MTETGVLAAKRNASWQIKPRVTLINAQIKHIPRVSAFTL